MKKLATKFDKWFRKQFGHHPTDYRQAHEIEADLKAAKAMVNKFQKEWDDKLRCADQFNAASYAKNATSSKFKF